VNGGPNGVAQQTDFNQGGWFNGPQMNNMGQPMFPGQDMSGAGWGYIQDGWDGGYANGMMGMRISHSPRSRLMLTTIAGYPMMNPMAMAQAGYGGGNFGNMGGGFNGQNGGGMGGWGSGWNQNNMGFNQGMAGGGMRNGGFYSAAATAGGYNHQSQGASSQQYHNPHFQRQQNFPRGGGFAGTGSNRPFNSDPSAAMQQQQTQQPQQDQQQQQSQQQNGPPSEQQGEPGEAAFQQQIQGIEEVVKKGPSSTSGESKGEKIPSVVGNGVAVEGSADELDAAAVAPSTDVEAAGAALPDSAVVLAGDDTAEQHHAEAAYSDMNMGGYHHHMGPDDYAAGFQHPYHPQPYMNPNFRGGLRGGPGFMPPRGGFRGHAVPPTIPPQEIGKGVEGAPTGPKAMREGRPNRGILPPRGGFAGRGSYGAPGGSSWSRR
jgi:hypothetical protein